MHLDALSARSWPWNPSSAFSRRRPQRCLAVAPVRRLAAPRILADHAGSRDPASLLPAAVTREVGLIEFDIVVGRDHPPGYGRSGR